jgi:hypothetical protein
MTLTSQPLEVERSANRKPITYRNVLDGVFAVFAFAGLIGYIEPSPYDFVSLIAMPMFFLSGFRIHSVQVFIMALWIIFLICGFIALLPYWDESETLIYQFQSLYLVLTVLCFTLYFGEHSVHRADLCMKGYTLGAFVCATVSVLAYFNIVHVGTAPFIVEGGRVAGTFKDPNVFGSYLIPGIVFLFQGLLISAGRLRILSLGALAILITGVLISYSRGSWGAAIFSVLMLIVASFVTAQTATLRRRIAIMTFLGVGAAVLFLVVLFSQENIRDFFLQRAQMHDYDEGSTGRFGNQLHAIPMLLDLPWGFGPLRFRKFFSLEPHNSYIGGFANDGWLGGLAWILIVLTTCFIGFRLMFVASPYRRVAQGVFPGLLALFLQGFQIDIDHWRQLYLFSGMIWGFEGARRRWLWRSRRTAMLERRVPGAAAALAAPGVFSP